MTPKERPLTANQLSFLQSARRHNGWAEKGPGAGWIWDSVSSTKKRAEALAARGYFSKEATPYAGVERFVLTDKALEAIAAHEAPTKNVKTTRGPAL